MEELVGIATPIQNGLVDKEFAIDVLTVNNQKAVLVCKSQPVKWGRIGFQLDIIGGGYNDASLMISGTNDIGSDKGRVFAYHMSSGNRLDKVGKFYFKQNQDLSIEIYFVAVVEEGLGYRTFIKRPLENNQRFQMSVVESIDISSIKEIEIE